LERAYFSDIDASAQPYFLLVPKIWAEAKESGRKLPLVVFLHGYVPRYDIHRWWEELPEFNAVCDRLGAFLLVPFGRSNSDFVGCGEEDVMAATDDVCRRYAIDPERIYLTGYSMGGMGVFTVAGHQPDRWAACLTLAARADSPLLMGVPGGLESMPAFKRRLVLADAPIELCENLLNLPIRMHHGRDDFVVPPEQAERLHKRLREVGASVTLKWWPGGHNAGFELLGSPEPLEWLLAQRRAQNPARKRLKQHCLRYGLRGDVNVLHLRHDAEPYDWEWQRVIGKNGNPKLELTRMDGPVAAALLAYAEENVSLRAKSGSARIAFAPAVENFPGRLLWDAGWCRGTKNDEEFNPAAQAAEFFPAGYPRWKTPLCCGPVKEATYGPFLLVYGTMGGEETAARLRRAAEDFAEMWRRFAKGRPPLKADVEVTEADMKRRNLFIFGDQKENAVLAKAAPQLPISVADGFAVIAGRKVSLAERGLMFIYPNPLVAPETFRTMVVVVGEPYGRHLPVNHKLDLIPDFLVYGLDADKDGSNTNKPIVAGYFDGQWRFDAQATWWFEERKK
jgi:predicted esterase